MISQNHFKQPIRAFVLDMFDIQLDADVLEKIRATGHLLTLVSRPTVDGPSHHQDAQKPPVHAEPSAQRDAVFPLTSDHRGAPSHTNLNDPSVRVRQPLVPIAKQEGFEERQESFKPEEQQESFKREFLFT